MDAKKMIEDLVDKYGQTDTAKRLGVSRMTIFNVLNERTSPSDKLLKALGLKRVQRVVRA